ncbi:MAG: hypothetical protein HC828_11335 [Blastochloris sp.]|nr:hypothetical protein [Blastochloris sp.]
MPVESSPSSSPSQLGNVSSGAGLSDCNHSGGVWSDVGKSDESQAGKISGRSVETGPDAAAASASAKPASRKSRDNSSVETSRSQSNP